MIRAGRELRAQMTRYAQALHEQGWVARARFDNAEALVDQVGEGSILQQAPEGLGYGWAGWLAPVFGALALALLGWTFWRLIRKA